ncbi:MAG: acetate--CoA ligase family protein [Desulfobacterales bacterium]|nr:acetate--CoA ligase family protein [Desulfobacterales bacterium]
MTTTPLDLILAPESIAVLGANNNPVKMGSVQMLNLLHSGFAGQVLPVHPREKTVCGRKAYPGVSDLPFAPDLVMMVIPPAGVAEMMDAFGRLGTRHAVIVSAGFKETGVDGAVLESELLAVAEKYGMRFLGPNCMGVINSHHPMNLSAGCMLDPPGHLGIATQSGTYTAQVPAWMHQRGIRISKSISIGNEADIDLVDCLEYLGQDSQTRAIGLYIECIRRADRFLEVARRVSRHKPIVAQYVGGTESGARSGASHTGAMAGPDYIYDGLFAQAGVIRVNTIEEVFRTGHTLAVQPPARGRRIAVLTNSGGPGTAMASTLDARGMTVPELPGPVRRRLEALLPGYASSKNPVDLTFHTDMTHLVEDFPRILLEADGIDGLLIHGIIDTGWAEMAYPLFRSLLDVTLEDFRAMLTVNLLPLIEMARQSGKPVLVSSFFGREDQALCTFQEAGIPCFDSPEKAAAAMADLYRNHCIRTRAVDGAVSEMPVPEAAREIMAGIGADGADEFTAKALIQAYGISTCNERRVHGMDAAVAAAADLGYPVAVKGCAPRIAHKSEHGLVHLNLADGDQVRDACRAIDRVIPGCPVLVCEMLRGDRELMAGMTRPDGFGPCILFGLGGIFTEAFRDVSVRLAPFGPIEASAMIRSIRSHRLLNDFRGRPAADMEILADLLVRLGNLACHFPQIREIDLNPIILCDGYPRVADALLVM